MAPFSACLFLTLTGFGHITPRPITSISPFTMIFDIELKRSVKHILFA